MRVPQLSTFGFSASYTTPFCVPSTMAERRPKRRNRPRGPRIRHVRDIELMTEPINADLDPRLRDFMALNNKWHLIFNFFVFVNPLERHHFIGFGLAENVSASPEWETQGKLEMKNPYIYEISKYRLLKETILDTGYFLSHPNEFFKLVQLYDEQVKKMAMVTTDGDGAPLTLVEMLDDIKWRFAHFLQADSRQVILQSHNSFTSLVVPIWRLATSFETPTDRANRIPRYFVDDNVTMYAFCRKQWDYDKQLAINVVGASSGKLDIIEILRPYYNAIVRNVYDIKRNFADNGAQFVIRSDTDRVSRGHEAFQSNLLHDAHFFIHLVYTYEALVNPLDEDLSAADMMLQLEERRPYIVQELLTTITALCVNRNAYVLLQDTVMRRYIDANKLLMLDGVTTLTPPTAMIVSSRVIVERFVEFIVTADEMFLRRLAHEGFKFHHETMVLDKNPLWLTYRRMCTHCTVAHLCGADNAFYAYTALYCSLLQPRMPRSAKLGDMLDFVQQHYIDYLRSQYFYLISRTYCMTVVAETPLSLASQREPPLKYSPLNRRFNFDPDAPTTMQQQFSQNRIDRILLVSACENSAHLFNYPATKTSVQEAFVDGILNEKNEQQLIEIVNQLFTRDFPSDSTDYSVNEKLQKMNGIQDTPLAVFIRIIMENFEKYCLTTNSPIPSTLPIELCCSYIEKKSFLARFFDYEEHIAYSIIDTIGNRTYLFEKLSEDLQRVLERVLQQDMKHINMPRARVKRQEFRDVYMRKLSYSDHDFLTFVRAIFTVESDDESQNIQEMMRVVEAAYETNIYRIITKVKLLVALYERHETDTIDLSDKTEHSKAELIATMELQLASIYKDLWVSSDETPALGALIHDIPMQPGELQPESHHLLDSLGQLNIGKLVKTLIRERQVNDSSDMNVLLKYLLTLVENTGRTVAQLKEIAKEPQHQQKGAIIISPHMAADELSLLRRLTCISSGGDNPIIITTDGSETESASSVNMTSSQESRNALKINKPPTCDTTPPSSQNDCLDTKPSSKVTRRNRKRAKKPKKSQMSLTDTMGAESTHAPGKGKATAYMVDGGVAHARDDIRGSPTSAASRQILRNCSKIMQMAHECTSSPQIIAEELANSPPERASDSLTVAGAVLPGPNSQQRKMPSQHQNQAQLERELLTEVPAAPNAEISPTYPAETAADDSDDEALAMAVRNALAAAQNCRNAAKLFQNRRRRHRN